MSVCVSYSNNALYVYYLLLYFILSLLALPSNADDIFLSESGDSLTQEDLLGEDSILVDDSLLYEDDYSIESTEEPSSERQDSAWRQLNEFSTISVRGDWLQGQRTDLLRSSLRIESEGSPISNFYFRIDNQLEYIFQEDRIAEQYGDNYVQNNLNEFWLQYSKQQCNTKIGRQFLFWGSVEGAYVVDVISPLDLTKPLLTDFSLIRQAQDMLVMNCFSGFGNFQAFVGNNPKTIKLTKSDALKSGLENSLTKEWGIKYTKAIHNTDLSVMYASIYENNPVVVFDAIDNSAEYNAAKQNMFGLTSVSNFDQLMFEIDLAYKTHQYAAQTYVLGDDISTKSLPEGAVGFEYLTNTNHQLSGSVWISKQRSEDNTKAQQWSQLWNMSWSKDYLNETLAMSLLINWQSQTDTASLTLQGTYEWNDYCLTSLALLMTDDSEDSVLNRLSSRHSVYLFTELQF